MRKSLILLAFAFDGAAFAAARKSAKIDSVLLCDATISSALNTLSQ
ncbi:hypothetical protein [Xanthomonas campestris]|nr:hypothetical protein [Xanthomonas campestris]